MPTNYWLVWKTAGTDPSRSRTRTRTTWLPIVMQQLQSLIACQFLAQKRTQFNPTHGTAKKSDPTTPKLWVDPRPSILIQVYSRRFLLHTMMTMTKTMTARHMITTTTTTIMIIRVLLPSSSPLSGVSIATIAAATVAASRRANT